MGGEGSMTDLGTKMRLTADQLRPGDFTTFTGFRHVLAVRPCSGKRIAITRADETIDRIARDQEIVVYRRDVA